MLTRGDLSRYKNSLNFNLGQVEREYIQHIFLYSLYRKIKDELVFKGGTCLQKTLGLNRFSDDLDFTLKGKADLTNAMKAVSDSITTFGYETDFGREKEDKMSTTLLFKTKGPLYDGTDRSLVYIRIEISTREQVSLEPVIKTITPIYHDLPPYTLVAMKVEEMLAEKIRAIIIRSKARDLFDLWFLIKKGVSIDFDLVNEKLEYYDLEFEDENFVKSLKKMGRFWEKELKPLVSNLPEFDDVIAEMLKVLKK